MRLWKCGALAELAGTVRLHVAGQVAKEFQAQGPSERAALVGLGATTHGVRPGTPAWEQLCLLRAGRCSTRDLGEDESLAVALTQIAQGEWLPFVTYDRQATRITTDLGVVALDFLDTLAWLVGCGVVTAERGDEIEALASMVDGWRRPAGYAGSIESVRGARQAHLIERVAAWRAKPGS
ncbi:MAG: hypothetical protein ACMG6S_12170 [Byssovorax sp.]